MRCFLLIPAFLLFLSNIPFFHEVDMKGMMAANKKDGCCNAENRKGSCQKSDEGQAFDHPPLQQNQSCKKEKPQEPCSKEERQCEKQTESTCICICCFHFAAPDQVGAKLQFECADASQSLASYLQANWKDPQLSLPWQPPDFN